jgi:hypothetical protein
MQKGMAGLRLMYRGYIRVKTVSCPDLLSIKPDNHSDCGCSVLTIPAVVKGWPVPLDWQHSLTGRALI